MMPTWVENCRNARGCFSTGDNSVQSGRYITAVLTRYKHNMNVKTTMNLLDIGLKWCFIKFSLHFEGVFLAARGCTCTLRGCSRTLKTPNSPHLDAHPPGWASYDHMMPTPPQFTACLLNAMSGTPVATIQGQD